jgi:hypothetical protein
MPFPLVITLLASPLAVQAGDMSTIRKACASDAKSFCGDVKRGGGAIKECLAANQAKLSPDCKAAIQGRKALASSIKDACADEVQAHCGGVERGAGRVRDCLAEHSGDLSQDCKDALEGARASGT